MTWSTAFLFTLALEIPVYAVVLHRHLRWRLFLFAILLGNSLTHPIVWNTILRFESYRTGFFVLESFAVVAEAGVILASARALGRTAPRPTILRCFGAALLANAFSAFIGPLLLTGEFPL